MKRRTRRQVPFSKDGDRRKRFTWDLASCRINSLAFSLCRATGALFSASGESIDCLASQRVTSSLQRRVTLLHKQTCIGNMQPRRCTPVAGIGKSQLVE